MAGEIVKGKSQVVGCRLKPETLKLLETAAEAEGLSPAKWMRDQVVRMLKRRYREPADACPKCGMICPNCLAVETGVEQSGATIRVGPKNIPIERMPDPPAYTPAPIPVADMPLVIRQHEMSVEEFRKRYLCNWAIEWPRIRAMGKAGRERFEELRAGREVHPDFGKWDDETRVKWLEKEWPL
jgi:hypothetical protein